VPGKSGWIFEMDELDKTASIANFVERKIYFMTILTKEVEMCGRTDKSPVVVGGTAVDIYTKGLFPSRDIDLIGYRRVIGEILEKKFGFARAGRHWVNERIGIFIEVPGDYFSGDKNKITTIWVGSLKLYVIGIEDLIIDRLNACVHWKSETDCDQARYMIRYYRDRLDFGYLEKKAKDEGILKTLREFCKEN
jgi:hypothetical protein